MAEAIRMGIVDVRLCSQQNSPVPRMGQSNSFSYPPRSGPKNPTSHPYHKDSPMPIRELLTPEPWPPYDRNAFGFSTRPPKRSSPTSSAYPDDNLPSHSQKRKFDGNSKTERASSYVTTSQSTQGSLSAPFILSGSGSDSDSEEGSSLPPPPRRRSRTANAVGLSKRLPQPSQPSARRPKGAAASQLSARDVFRRNGLDASAPAAPNADVIEEDL
jgi:hypothetical protein